MTAAIFSQQQYGGGGASGTTWNPADKATGITLSNGDLTVTWDNLLVDMSVRGTASHSTGKRAFSLTAGPIVAGEAPAVGVANSAYDINQTLGITTDDAAAYPYGETYYDNTPGVGPIWIEGDDVIVAVDIDNALVWFAVNGVFVGDPVAGTGGLSIPGVCGGAVYPCVYSFGTSAVAATNFGATAFAYPLPTGFSAWDA